NGNFDKYRNRVLAEVEARERRVEQQMEANRKSKMERHAARLGRKRLESAHVAAEAKKKADEEAAAATQPAKLELTGPKNGKKAKLGIAAMMDEARKKRKEDAKKKRIQEQKEKEEAATATPVAPAPKP
ncbi:ATP-binding cassette sub- F member 1, partial [Perkinsus olseni]